MIDILTKTEVKVLIPPAFAADRSLSFDARVLGMLIQTGLKLRYDPGELVNPHYLAEQMQHKLSEKAIAKAITELEASAWEYDKPFVIKQGDNPLRVSNMLLLDARLTSSAKLLYCFLLTLGTFTKDAVSTRFSELQKQFGLGFNTVKRGFAALRAAGWLNTRQKHKHAPIQVWLISLLDELMKAYRKFIPIKDPAMLDVEGDMERPPHGNPVVRDQATVQEAQSDAEGLFLGALTVLVDCNYYDDHYTPGFFPDFGTGRRMHLDRMYHRYGVGIEFNGDQHYRPTKQFGPEVVARQKANDYNKQGLCKVNGIKLLVFTFADFSVKRITKKLKGILPLRVLPQSIYAHLERQFKEYLQRCRRNDPQQEQGRGLKRGSTGQPDQVRSQEEIPGQGKEEARQVQGRPPASTQGGAQRQAQAPIQGPPQGGAQRHKVPTPSHNRGQTPTRTARTSPSPA